MNLINTQYLKVAPTRLWIACPQKLYTWMSYSLNICIDVSMLILRNSKDSATHITNRLSNFTPCLVPPQLPVSSALAVMQRPRQCSGGELKLPTDKYQQNYNVWIHIYNSLYITLERIATKRHRSHHLDGLVFADKQNKI